MPKDGLFKKGGDGLVRKGGKNEPPKRPRPPSPPKGQCPASEHLGDAKNYLMGSSQMREALRKIIAILGPKVEQYPVEDPRCGIACEAGMALEVAEKALEIKPKKE